MTMCVERKCARQRLKAVVSGTVLILCAALDVTPFAAYAGAAGANAYTYDGLGRVRSVTYSNGSTVSYTYDQAGNRTQKTDAQGTTGYSYDGLHRLETVTPPAGGPVHYEYDGAGNRLTQNAGGVLTTSSYDAANQLVTFQTGTALTTLTYDGAGNRRSENASGSFTTYTWNQDNKLTGIVLPTGVRHTMLYSADGDLRQQSVGSTSTSFTRAARAGSKAFGGL